jgi:sortase (surface protein transpeptidase)
MGRRGRKRFVVGVGLAVAIFGALGAAMAAHSHVTGPESIARAPELADREASGRTARGASAPRRQMSIPVRISIPAIGVNARVIPLGLNRDRTIQVPRNLNDTGWFRPGPEPGEQGAAVIVGHLASRSRPGVFYRLRHLPVGGVIRVHLKGGDTVRFMARSMVRVPKNRFPTKRVYAHTKMPTLRLVTCAGRLNPSTGHHDDNYIVFASIIR